MAQNRISKKKEFDGIFKKGKSAKAPHLIIRYAKSSGNQSRFAFMVSQKVSKKAVVRNKVRRRLSEITRSALPLASSFDVVFIALPGIDQVSFPELKTSVASLLKKL